MKSWRAIKVSVLHESAHTSLRGTSSLLAGYASRGERTLGSGSLTSQFSNARAGGEPVNIRVANSCDVGRSQVGMHELQCLHMFGESRYLFVEHTSINTVRQTPLGRGHVR